MQPTKVDVRQDEHGVLRVGGTRVMLDSVIAAYRAGHPPESIQEQYPALTLEDVRLSIAYYLKHQDEVDAYLRRQDAVWTEWQARSEARPSSVVERLRTMRHADRKDSA